MNLPRFTAERVLCTNTIVTYRGRGKAASIPGSVVPQLHFEAGPILDCSGDGGCILYYCFEGPNASYCIPIG